MNIATSKSSTGSNPSRPPVPGGLQRFAAGGADRLKPEDAYYNTGGAPILDAAALPVRAAKDVSGEFNSQTCTLLVLQNAKWSHICGSVLRRRWLQCGIKSTTLLIVVSLTDLVTAYEEAEAWLKFASKFLPEQVEETDKTRGSANKESFLSAYADLRDETKQMLTRRRTDRQKNAPKEPEPAAGGSPASPPEMGGPDEDIINMGVQVIVCGCKADTLPSLNSSSTPEKRNEELIFTIYMRELCRQYGAYLLFLNAEDDDNLNFGRLNDLITSPITKEEVPLTPVTSSMHAFYVPAGWDTRDELENMAVSCGVASLTVPLQTIVRKAYGDEDFASKLEHNTRDTRIQVPPPFDQFLKSLAATADTDVAASVEGLKMIKAMEDEGGKRGPGEESDAPPPRSTISPTRADSSTGPASAMRSAKLEAGSPPASATPTPGGGDAAPPQRSVRITRDRSARTPKDGEAVTSGRKAGGTLMSSLMDLKKSRPSGDRRSG
eukprot:Blabericola_migrator_1__2257@NODE_1623_length_4147_cov_81_794363_g116_i1_p1_GENE_NODE_1623_length_4147_cov_81_794363_g116_i1NODE_1623_length_4147_cov_81_794363_g116_i1_p1_ORF_typecomplete_len493_score108_27DLIC/PF05783_11/1e14_NODE_1623_length_4147_cov_81_794363_g116_i116133091